MPSHEQGARETGGRWLALPRTLCFVYNGDDVLLMKRAATRRVFPNRYNGVGGHVERDESPLTCARREILEETGLHVSDLRLRAIYNVDANEATGITLFIFTGWSSTRDVVANVEGTLHWIPRAEVFALDLVDDLPLLLPRLFGMAENEPPLFAHVGYDEADQLIIRWDDKA